ncbi:hypothetical protein [Kitasatospora sp. NPDC057500]|uniref:hypothetical protein n=1 Tax=Kitasatospora sp. NPDC057500 TaxID=3346151 RepID=UPI0036A71EEB
MVDAVSHAVVAERVRGSGWERIGKPFMFDAEEAEAKWGTKAEEWRSQTKVQSALVRDPASYLEHVDRRIAAGRTVRQPPSKVIDATAVLTGRDVAAADRAFASTQRCDHCHR